jgi:ABC-type nitrate/sulfonate/bicarbonate transport system ATPase subunit
VDGVKSKLIEVKNVSKTFRSETASPLQAFRDVSFSIDPGEFLCLVGKSGCGKTTLLRILAGLETQTSGHVVGRPSQKDVGVVFQEYSRSLFPWFSVHRQLQIAGKYSLKNPDEISDQIETVLKITGLDSFRSFLPHELSGGLQQRLCVARALMQRPQLLLMDEPFGSVDAGTRYQLEDEILRIWDSLKFSVLFITHDLDEAIYLGDRVLVMNGSPGTIDHVLHVNLPRPRRHSATRTTADFFELRRDLWGFLHHG